LQQHGALGVPARKAAKPAIVAAIAPGRTLVSTAAVRVTTRKRSPRSRCGRGVRSPRCGRRGILHGVRQAAGVPASDLAPRADLPVTAGTAHDLHASAFPAEAHKAVATRAEATS
jgi:hypothetical protein